ncbi:MAG: hypothetical protein U9O98_06105 [Asgard group archaeon]|nr:hypothetical protein [Asgard group archaeon]
MFKTTDFPPREFSPLLGIAIAIFSGILEGAISGGMVNLFLLFHDLITLSIVVIWIVYGFLARYYLRIKTIDLLLHIIFASFTSAVIYYFSSIYIWYLLMLSGISVLFWAISLISSLLLFPLGSSYYKKE